ncbi:MAG: hypothetical protein H0W90_16990 [Actinobacteria bacterium]|nr:hypothetical protein [Actinomycetota bacterium]
MLTVLSAGCRDALGFFLVGTGLLKFWHPEASFPALGRIGIPERLHFPVLGAVATAEIGLGAVLVITQDRLVLVPIAILLAVFSSFLVFLDRRAPNISCGCLGDFGTGHHLTGVFRNIVLLGLVVIGAADGASMFSFSEFVIGFQIATMVLLVTEGISVVHLVSREEGKGIIP